MAFNHCQPFGMANCCERDHMHKYKGTYTLRTHVHTTSADVHRKSSQEVEVGEADATSSGLLNSAMFWLLLWICLSAAQSSHSETASRLTWQHGEKFLILIGQLKNKPHVSRRKLSDCKQGQKNRPAAAHAINMVAMSQHRRQVTKKEAAAAPPQVTMDSCPWRISRTLAS